MKAECKQEPGYTRIVQICDSDVRIQLDITEREARQIVAAIAYGFGNLVTSEHIWQPILEAAQ